MEKVGGMRVPGEGEIPAGMEEQDDYTTSVHAEGVEARQNDLRDRGVYRGKARLEIRGRQNRRVRQIFRGN